MSVDCGCLYNSYYIIIINYRFLFIFVFINFVMAANLNFEVSYLKIMNGLINSL